MMKTLDQKKLSQVFLRKSSQLFFNFLKDERGQSTTEYILILSVVVIVAMKFKSSFQSALTGAVAKLGGNIDKALDDNAQ